MRQRSDDRYGQLLMLPEIRFAHAAVGRLRDPAAPLVTVYGAAGSGKTHLAMSILRDLTREEPRLKWSHVDTGEFSAEFAKASKVKTIPEFQESYRCLNLLVFEDLQALEGRHQFQQQLLAILDEILAQGGRILLTSSQSPGELCGFSSKLRSRCQGGISAAIEPLGPESREKLIRHFAAERGIGISDNVAELLARALGVSPRELRGNLIQLELLAKQRRRPIDRELAEEVIRDTLVPKTPTLGQITKVVATAFSVTAAELRTQGRLQGLVLPRQLAMFAAREWVEQPYSEIGRYFHRRSHSTIVHACQRIQKLLETDADFSRLVDGVREQLNISRPIHSLSSKTP